MVLLIISFLDLEDFAHLLIGLTILEAGREWETTILKSMTRILWQRVTCFNSKHLQWQRYEDGIPNFSLETLNASISRYKSLKRGVYLLTEYRVLDNLSNSILFNDYSRVFQTNFFKKNTESHAYSICFNLQFNLIAIAHTERSKGFVEVLAYGNQLTKNLGPQVYFYETSGVSSDVNISWSPSGKLLLCLVRRYGSDTPFDQLHFFRYFPRKRIMRELLDFNLKSRIGQCKATLWIGPESFVFPSYCDSDDTGLTLVTFKSPNNYSIRRKCNVFPVSVGQNVTRGCISGHLLSPGRYCLCCIETCSKDGHFDHHRIIISIWSSGILESIKILDLPGLVADLAFLKSKIFVLFHNHPEYTFMPENVSFTDYKKSPSCDPMSCTPPCTLDSPWQHKTSKEKKFTLIRYDLLDGSELRKMLQRFSSMCNSNSFANHLNSEFSQPLGGAHYFGKISKRHSLHVSAFNFIAINFGHIINTGNLPSRLLTILEHCYHEGAANFASIKIPHPLIPVFAVINYCSRIDFELANFASLADQDLYPKKTSGLVYNNGIHARLLSANKQKYKKKKM